MICSLVNLQSGMNFTVARVRVRKNGEFSRAPTFMKCLRYSTLFSRNNRSFFIRNYPSATHQRKKRLRKQELPNKRDYCCRFSNIPTEKTAIHLTFEISTFIVLRLLDLIAQRSALNFSKCVFYIV